MPQYFLRSYDRSRLVDGSWSFFCMYVPKPEHGNKKNKPYSLGLAFEQGKQKNLILNPDYIGKPLNLDKKVNNIYNCNYYIQI